MKKIHFLAFAFISILRLNAQSQCATDELDAYLRRTNPQYAAERQKMEQQIYSILKNKQNNPNARIAQNDCQPNGVFTIPVVFHVIHLGESVGTGTNISDATITSSLADLNKRFRRVIGDGVDLEIQFALAVRDPNGNATTGINRVNGSSVLNYAANGVDGANGANEKDIKDLSKWPTNRYFNIWIVKTSAYSGEATLPSSFNVDYQGIKIAYNVIWGGLLAHETGHFLGLYHTFQGDNNNSVCPVNNDCLLDGDKVCDTPPHKSSECTTRVCSVNGDFNNVYKNYMSYCGSANWSRFTQGQKDRVRNMLYSQYRWNLITSDALIPLSVPLEAGIVDLENYLNEPICNNFTPKLKVRNSGNTTITNFKIDTYIDGVFYNSNIINTSLIKNASSIFLLQNLNFSTSGQHNVKFSIAEINGSTNDYSTLNNQICHNILVRNNSVNSFCLNLEDNTVNSLLFNSDSIYNPKLTNVSGCSNTGSKVLKYNNTSTLNTDNAFYLPQFNLDSVYSAYLVFDHAYKLDNISSKLWFGFWAVDGCDSSAKFIYSLNNNQLASVSGRDSLNTWTPTSCSNWKKDSIYLNHLGLNNLLLKCAAWNYGYLGNQPLYLDNFCIHKRYQINATVNPSESGYITYSNPIQYDIYDEGSSATITATPYTCKSFKNWTENGVVVSTNPSYTFTVNRNRNLVANFERAQYTITLSPDNVANGTVTGNGTFGCDTIITIKAIPTSCYTFTNWTENGTIVSANSNYSFRFNENRNLVANFTKKRFTVTASPDNISNGTVSGSGTYACDTITTLVATPTSCYTFTNWTENGNVVSNNSTYSFTVTANRNLTANFERKIFTITLSNTPGGTASGGGDVYCGSTITVSADHNSCYTFKNWTENGTIVSTNANYSFTVSANKNLVANFDKNRYTISVSPDNFANGSVSGSGTFGCDSITTVTATPASCYTFTKWTENGSTVSTNANYSFNVNRNRTLKAIFEPKRYNITLVANPTNGGTISGAGNFACDSSITVNAKIKPGFKFTNWTEGTTVVSTDSNYTFLISGARSLKANFSLVTGIKQTTINEISKIYPNPANEILQIEIRSKQNTSLTLNIIDMKGSLLETKTINNMKGTLNTSFDVSNLAKGNYLLNLYDEEGMASYKFVVQ